MDEELMYRYYRDKTFYNYINKEEELKRTSERRKMLVPEIIGKGCCNSLIEFQIDFPAKYPCMELKNTCMDVKELNFQVCKNKVIANGVLFYSADYKVYDGKAVLRCNCEKRDAFFGSIKNISAGIPFSCYTEVKGAQPHDDVRVVFAGVEGASDNNRLVMPFSLPGIRIKFYRGLMQSVLVKIEFMVLRQTTIPADSEDSFREFGKYT